MAARELDKESDGRYFAAENSKNSQEGPAGGRSKRAGPAISLAGRGARLTGPLGRQHCWNGRRRGAKIILARMPGTVALLFDARLCREKSRDHEVLEIEEGYVIARDPKQSSRRKHSRPLHSSSRQCSDDSDYAGLKINEVRLPKIAVMAGCVG